MNLKMRREVIVVSLLLFTETGPNWAAQLSYQCLWRARCEVNTDHNGSGSQPCQTWGWHPIWNPSKIFITIALNIVFPLSKRLYHPVTNRWWTAKTEATINHAPKSYTDSLQVRTHFARPNWKEVFTKIASKHPYATVGKDTRPKCRIVNYILIW